MGKMSKQKKRRTRTHKRSGQSRLTMISISFVVCVLFGILLYNGHRLEMRIAENQARIDELHELKKEQEQRTQDIYDLEEEMQTEEYIASVAQSKLGLVKEDEIIFKPQK